MKTSGIKHRKITPGWPQANARDESFNKPLKNAIRTAHLQKRNWRKELTTFFRTYRSTPHTSTMFTPFKLMFDRNPKTKIPDSAGPKHHTAFPEQHFDNTQLQRQDGEAKRKTKECKDTRNHATLSDIKTGDFVLLKQQKQNKLSTPFNPTPIIVTDTKGSMVTSQSTTHPSTTVTRNSSHYHS